MDQTFLVFGHRGARYGLDVRQVREIVWLPQLSAIEELPAHIAGVFNLRGRIVPVMDLGLRFGHPHLPWTTGDRVIVIDSGNARVGVVANELHDVLAIAPEAIENARSYQGAGGHARFVCGEAKSDAGLVMLLDIEELLHSTPSEEALALAATGDAEAAHSPGCGELTPAAAEVFRDRARNLAAAHASGDRSGLDAFAVIRLDGEIFGLALHLVREFSHLRGITPVPCCPAHILGNMNLRGNILTLVDIRPALGMASEGELHEVVVVRAGEVLLGLPAAEIVDVVHLAPTEITAVPIASKHAGKAYCSGVATIGGRAMGILDMEKLLAANELRVMEEVH
jgi:purine-binding chemotaxis protein CheW